MDHASRPLTQHESETAFLDTVVSGNISLMKSMIKEPGFPIEVRNEALKKAITFGHLKYVAAILPFCDKSNNFFLPAATASKFGTINCLKLVLPDNPDTVLPDHVLGNAARNGHLECVSLILNRKGCTIRARMEALRLSITAGCNKVVARLLEDTDVRDRCKTIERPFFAAIVGCNHEALQMLLPLLEGEIKEAESEPDDVLMAATSYRSFECLELLLSQTNVRPSLRHISNAIDTSSQECVQILAPVVNLDKHDDSFFSTLDHPLVDACYFGQPKSIAALAEYTNDADVINVAALNGMWSYLKGASISRKDLAPVLQKATQEGLTRLLSGKDQAPETYIVTLSTEPGQTIKATIAELKRELEVLNRSDKACGHSPQRQKRARTGVKL